MRCHDREHVALVRLGRDDPLAAVEHDTLPFAAAAVQVQADEVRDIRGARPRDDGIGCTFLHDATVLHNENPICEDEGVDGVVRHQEARSS